ncbi:MAG: alpha/beta hydrolase [Nostoc sp.]|uniref:alpha/beta fold hydrolase n=1 Tax=Nostoc sp. TaxID=1180 RepID=UPI002FF92C8D
MIKVFDAYPNKYFITSIRTTRIIVTQSDRAINPELQRFMAKRINAKTTEVNSSHVPFISHPKEVTKVIEAASTAVK